MPLAVLAEPFVPRRTAVDRHRLAPSDGSLFAGSPQRRDGSGSAGNTGLVEFAAQSAGQPQRPHAKIGGEAPQGIRCV